MLCIGGWFIHQSIRPHRRRVCFANRKKYKYHKQSVCTGHQYKPRLVTSFEEHNVKQICACGFHSACVTGLVLGLCDIEAYVLEKH